MPNDGNRVKEIFLEAAELTDEAARSAYLDRACGSDAGLRERVEALLRAHDPAGSFLGSPAVKPKDLNGATKEVSFDQGATPDDDTNSADDLPFLAPSSWPDSLGRLGHYEMLQLLGKGGFGVVFRAFDETLQRVVAVKVMAPQIAMLSPARKRFLREARSSAQIRHENVVQIYEVGEQPLPYLAMEFIPGETLQQKLNRTGPLDAPEVLRVGRQIAEGLSAAHACDLIHRDIKPANVLIEGGPQQRVKITDFGLARAADDASISQSGLIAGTPMYMAPEQAKGEKLDQRADLFSLGSVLYQMVAGRPPFRAPSTLAVLKRVAEETPRPLPEIIPETPAWLCEIIAKLHAKNPHERYQSAREVADVLADCEAHLKAHAKVKDISRISRGKPQRSGWWKLVVAAVLLLLLSVVALAVLWTAAEFAGVQPPTWALQTMRDPIKPDGEPRVQASKQETKHADDRVQLFNGKDLTGWKPAPGSSDNWQVVNGEIVCKDADFAYLYSERGDYENFHVRAEVRVNDGGDCGLWFRARSEMETGYQANINCSSGEQPARTGSLAWWDEGSADWLIGRVESPVPAEMWFWLEVIAQGPEITLLVNGKAIDVRDRDERSLRGHIAFSTFRKHSALRVRSIEIKELPPPTAAAPFTDADVRRIAALPADQQIEEVRKELMRRNPGFDGTMRHKIEDGVVTEFRIVTDRVTDIAPIRVFSALRALDCNGTQTNGQRNGQLADLTPLEGMNLAGLTHLSLGNTKVGDAGLAHFKDCKSLTQLHLDNTQVSDTGLAHFKGIPLKVLWICKTGITDLTSLQGMPLEEIRLTPKNITRGLEILRDMKSLKTIGVEWNQAWPAAEFWERYDMGEFTK